MESGNSSNDNDLGTSYSCLIDQPIIIKSSWFILKPSSDITMMAMNAIRGNPFSPSRKFSVEKFQREWQSLALPKAKKASKRALPPLLSDKLRGKRRGTTMDQPAFGATKIGFRKCNCIKVLQIYILEHNSIGPGLGLGRRRWRPRLDWVQLFGPILVPIRTELWPGS